MIFLGFNLCEMKNVGKTIPHQTQFQIAQRWMNEPQF